MSQRRTRAEIDQAKRKALAARKNHLKAKHRMTLEEYDAIKAFQGGFCYMCQRANGNTKALAVDHDHALAKLHDHPVNESCSRCWRGLLCSTCNKTLAHARDYVMFFWRGQDYLNNPPVRRLARQKLLDESEVA